MKRILIMLLAASLVFSFVACSEKEEEEKKESVNYEEKMAESVSVDSTQIIDGEEGALRLTKKKIQQKTTRILIKSF